MKLLRIAERTSLIYVGAGLLWIQCSDWLLGVLVTDPVWLVRIGTVKGFAFVAFTGALLYLVLRREVRRWEVEAEGKEAVRTELAEFQAKLTELALSVPGVVYAFRLRADGGIEMPYASPRLREMFGVDPAAVVTDARPLIQMVNPEDRGKLLGSIEGSARTMVAWHCVFRVRNADGGEIWVEGRSIPRREPDGSVLWHGLLLDATDRHRAELSLQRQQAELQMILDSVPALIFYKDREHRMLRVNAEVLRVTGRQREDVEGRTETENGSPYAESYYRDENEVLASGEPKIGIVERLSTAAGDRWMRTDKFPYRDEQGRIIGVVGFALDITGQMRAEEVKARQLKVIEAIRRAQEEYIGSGSLRAAMGTLLEPLLDFTTAEYGFLGEVLADVNGRPYLQFLALSNIAWDDKTRELYARHETHGLIFSNLNSLFGAVITGGELVISNDPSRDPRRGGLPPGHPPLRAFLGIPLKHGSEVVGVIGVANRPGGFGEEVVAGLGPLLTACVSLIQADREGRRHRESEAARLQGELRFRSLVETIDQIFWTSAPGASRPDYVSPAVETITGWPAEHFLRNPDAWSELVVPEDRPKLAATIAAELEGRRAPVEYRILNRAGQQRWIWSRVFPVRDETGAVVAFNGIASDITERRETELALMESEQRFQRIFESSPVLHSMSSYPEGRCLMVNRHFTERLGYTIEDLRGVDAINSGAWVNPEQRAQLLREVEAGGPVLARECLMRAKDGSVRTLLTSVDRVVVNGRSCLVFAAADITERKTAEAALEQSLSLARAALESTADGILVVDLDGRFVDFNAQFLEIWRISVELLPGLRPDNPIAADCDRPGTGHILDQLVDPAAHVAKVADLQSRPDAISFGELRLRDGRIVESFSVPQRIHGNPVGRVWSFRDVTLRREAEEGLRAAKRDLEVLVEAMPDLIVFQDVSGCWLIANQAARRLFRVEQRDWRGRTHRDLSGVVPELDAVHELCLRREREAWAAGDVLRSEEQIPLANGTVADLEFSRVPMFDALGAPRGLLVVGRDLTVRHQLEQQLRHSQKMEAIGQLAGGIAHDFNNLLTVIHGNVSLLLAPPHLGETDTGLAGEILAASQRAAGLTRQLLLFGRKSAMQARDLDLNEVVSNLTKILLRTLGDEITFRVQLASGLCAVRADAGMIEQVLLNLAVNSRDAMPQGGTLTVSTEEVEVTPEMLPANPDATVGRFVVLTVTDTGRGMAPEILPRIFDPFFTTKAVGEGTGLGLATVYGIVQQHRGRVEVTSEVGQGTTFRVLLPALDRTAAAEMAVPGGRRPAFPSGGQGGVLVVEDEAAVRTLVSGLLERNGFRVFSARSGVEAVRIWAENASEVSLLFTDITMPDGLTGVELAKRLRQQDPGLGVIVTSGFAADLGSYGLAEIPDCLFLQKPFSPAELSEAVSACLQRRVS